jgi:hypothetical protein
MKKTLILVGAAVIVLSTTLAFRHHSEKATVPQKSNTSAASNSGYALQDRDQWK